MLFAKHTSTQSVLIIIHGLFGNSDNWQTLAKRYAKDFSVFSVDLRNHGQSAHFDSMTYTEMAADVYAFATNLGITKAHVMGHSMGGKVAMQLANDFPHFIDKLIVCDISAKAYAPHFQNYIAAMQSINFASVTSRKDVDEALKPAVPKLGVRQFLLKNIERTSEGQLRWQINLDAIERNYSHLINKIDLTNLVKMKSLFIRGERSNYISVEDIEWLKQHFERASFSTIKNAGHWLHAEQPDAFYESSMKFLHD